MLSIRAIIITFSLLIFSSSVLYAEKDKPQGMPPAIVVVAEIRAGMVAPEMDFIGTVYYKEVSNVASEVNGLVESVEFEEGKRVKKGQLLVKLSSELLNKTLNATKASHEQVLSEVEKAKLDFARAGKLYKNKLVSEEMYDEKRFTVNGLEKKAVSLKAEVERLEVELQKKSIRAPFDSIVIEKNIDRGEWLSPGSVLATVANDSMVDILVEVPLQVIKSISPGINVEVKTGGAVINGKVYTIIPKGNISTRTFPVKIRVKNTMSLVEGMEAIVSLPVSHKEESLTVHRDAIITVYGKTVIYTVNDMKASSVPVKVNGYSGMTAGIFAEGLKEGMKVVVKGNERLRPGQPVIIKE